MITYYPNHHHGETWTLTPIQFFEWLRDREVQVTDDAKTRLAFGPHVLNPRANGHRENKNVDFITYLVIDIDAATLDVAKDARERVLAKRWLAFMHTTWSHDPATGLYNLRIIIAITKPVAPSMVANFLMRTAAALGLRDDIDRTTLDAARLFYLTCRKSDQPEPYREIFYGEPLDPATLADARPVSRTSLEALAKRLSKTKGKEDIGKALSLALAGEPYAEQGNRDNMCFQLANMMPWEYPFADFVTLAKHFDRSASHWPDAPSMLAKLERAYAQKCVKSDEAIDRRKEYWERMGQQGRTEPYNSTERAEFAKAFCTDNGIKWLFGTKDGVHFLTINGYTEAVPLDTAGAAVAAEIYLSPAPLNITGEDGNTLPVSVLISRHGSTHITVQYALYDVPLAEQYDPKARTLTLTRTHQRFTVPEYSADAAGYLAALVGPAHVDALTTWLGLAVDLREPVPAVYLWGAPGSGKGFFATAFSAGWSNSGPISGDVAMGQFNEPLAGNPTVLIDEMFTRDHQGRPKTPEFRTLTGERNHTLNGKHKLITRVLGCPRVIMAANHDRMLSVGDHQTDDDISALAMRLLVFHVSLAGGAFLDALPEERRKALADGGLFRHALWCAQYAKRDGTRFGMPNNDRSFVDSMLVSSGARPLICQWVYGHLARPVSGVHDAIRVVADPSSATPGVVWVHPGGVHAHWARYLLDVRRPESLAKLSQSVLALCDGPPGADSWAAFSLDRLRAWARTSGVVTPEALDRLVFERASATTRAAGPPEGGVVLPFRPAK